jgi:hypothetical protein
LDQLGVIWTPLEVRWEKTYQELVTFQKREGHGDVPIRCRENPRLGHWAAFQLLAYRRGRLSTERKAKLDALRIVWSPGQKK